MKNISTAILTICTLASGILSASVQIAPMDNPLSQRAGIVMQTTEVSIPKQSLISTYEDAIKKRRLKPNAVHIAYIPGESQDQDVITLAHGLTSKKLDALRRAESKTYAVDAIIGNTQGGGMDKYKLYVTFFGPEKQNGNAIINRIKQFVLNVPFESLIAVQDPSRVITSIELMGTVNKSALLARYTKAREEKSYPANDVHAAIILQDSGKPSAGFAHTLPEQMITRLADESISTSLIKTKMVIKGKPYTIYTTMFGTKKLMDSLDEDRLVKMAQKIAAEPFENFIKNDA